MRCCPRLWCGSSRSISSRCSCSFLRRSGSRTLSPASSSRSSRSTQSRTFSRALFTEIWHCARSALRYWSLPSAYFLGVPVAFYAAKVASLRTRRLLIVLFLVPLWASYLVRAYAWRGLLSEEGGVITWLLQPIGMSGPGYGYWAIVIVLTYLWLPFMILPVYASLDRLPNSLLDASGDLGAKAGRTFRSVVLPIILPGIAAGSIFTFSLSLGDYIAVQLVGGDLQLLGNAIYTNIAGGGNTPLGAALALFSVIVIVIYMLLVRRTGALREL